MRKHPDAWPSPRQEAREGGSRVRTVLELIRRATRVVTARPGNADNPLREVLETCIDATDAAIAWETEAIRIALLPVTAPLAWADSRLPARIAGMHKRVFQTLAGCVVVLAEFIRANVPVEQPQALAPHLTYNRSQGETQPSPGHEPAEALVHVASVESLCEHLQRVCRFRIPNPPRFVMSYKMSPEEMHAVGEACCNGFGNAQSECLAYHGMKSYTVSLWPENILQRATRDWHQFTVVSVVAGKRYVVIDSAHAFVHDGTLDSLIRERYRGMRILDVQEWRRLRDHPFAKFGGHLLYGGVDEEAMESYPRLLPPNQKADPLPRNTPGKDGHGTLSDTIFSALRSQ